MKKIITLLGLACLVLQPIVAQNKAENPAYKQRAEIKISDIKKFVTLDSLQECKLKNAYIIYSLSSDSITANQQLDKILKEKWQRKINKQWQMTLMNTIDAQQRVIYLAGISKSKIDSLVTVDMHILQESQLYSTDELSKMKDLLISYHTQERIILERDKYDPAAKQENIIWLRTQRPQAYKLCESIKEMQKAGVLKDGNIIW
jgi:hypothetical protein